MVATFFALTWLLAVDDAVLRRLEVFSRALFHVEKHYVQPVDNERLMHAAIAGMVGTLDPYSVYLSGPELQKLKLGETRIGRTGLLLNERASALVVGAVHPQSPAMRAGLLVGDEVLAIDGVGDLRLALAEQRLLGVAGSVVQVQVNRPGFLVPRVFSLVRETLPGAAAQLNERDGIAVLRISYFPDGVAITAAQQLRSLRKGMPVVIDLRDNPGGLVDQSSKVAELLMDGELATYVGREGQPPQIVRSNKAPLVTGPVWVVINRGSASAAEMLTASLKARGRATVVGERSFGKGSVQSLLEFDDGSALKLTTAKFLDQKGRPLDGFGVEPDVVESSELALQKAIKLAQQSLLKPR